MRNRPKTSNFRDKSIKIRVKSGVITKNRSLARIGGIDSALNKQSSTNSGFPIHQQNFKSQKQIKT
jgi:hypothetical protein